MIDLRLKEHNIFADIFWTIVNIGLFNIYIQIRQILDVNEIMKEDQFSFWKMILLTIITLGFYFVYHEYRMTVVLHELVGRKDKSIEIGVAVLTFLGFWFVVDSYQQVLINEYLRKYGLPAAISGHNS